MTVSKPEWTRIDPNEFNRLRTQNVGGVDTDVALSPHDVPVALRSWLDNTMSVLMIEFQYLDDEVTVEHSQPDGITVKLGQHSKRLFGVVVPFAFIKKHAGVCVAVSPQVENVAASAVESFERAQERAPWAARMRDSYDTVRNVLREKFVEPVGAD